MGVMQGYKLFQVTISNLGMGIIMDMVPNHSSDEHEWFVKSEQKIDPYTDYYVWKPAKGLNASGDPIPPNNWVHIPTDCAN
jgi:glycosidase